MLAEDYLKLTKLEIVTVVLGIGWKGRRELCKVEQREDPTSKLCSFEEVFAGNFAVL